MHEYGHVKTGMPDKQDGTKGGFYEKKSFADNGDIYGSDVHAVFRRMLRQPGQGKRTGCSEQNWKRAGFERRKNTKAEAAGR